MPTPLLVSVLTALALTAVKPDGNRLAYLDENSPYYPGLAAPKLVTPQWVGEPGVEAVVVLSIDDLNDQNVAKIEPFLRPILDRLRAIEGRAPLSIMTCKVKPDDPRLAAWISAGVNLDVHTLTHAYPLLQKGDFKAARDAAYGGIDLLASIPANHPVAFRMPYCDSRDTQSPRFYAEIFNATTPARRFLTIDSSVFNLTTPADTALPPSLTHDREGRPRFHKYLPSPSYVNSVENYPYPYVIGRLCWEFPCAVPSDWQGWHRNGPNAPATVDDLKAALDAVVLKQGVFTFLFHPHNWIQAGQVVALIDHAVSTHGKKVKFLNFREAQERIDRNLLGGVPLRNRDGQDNGVRVLDLDNDGYMDVVIGNDRARRTRLWDPSSRSWHDSRFPTGLVSGGTSFAMDHHACFGVVRPDGHASVLIDAASGRPPDIRGAWHFDGSRWVEAPELLEGLTSAFATFRTAHAGIDDGVRLRDLDGDGRCELIAWPDLLLDFHGIFAFEPRTGWTPLPFALPDAATVVMTRQPEGRKQRFDPEDVNGLDAGLRFVDLDGDGRLDVVYSNDRGYGVYLFESLKNGWSRRVVAGKPGAPGALPPIVRVGGDAWQPRIIHDDEGLPTLRIGKPNYVTDNGFWVHSRHLWWQNEDTDTLPDHVDRRSFDALLKKAAAKPRE